MRIIKVADDEKLKFQELLLLADESMEMIGKYLYRGEMFALYDKHGADAKSICVVTNEGGGSYELKNIATEPEYQGAGRGKKLLSFLIWRYRGLGDTLLVGTGDSPAAIGFYNSRGFAYSHTVKNFFTDNYGHPMYIENGKQLTDMIYLKRKL